MHKREDIFKTFFVLIFLIIFLCLISFVDNFYTQEKNRIFMKDDVQPENYVIGDWGYIVIECFNEFKGSTLSISKSLAHFT